MYDLVAVLFPLPYFIPALCPDPSRTRFFTLSTYAKGTFRICNNVAHNLLQGFAVCKRRAKRGLGVKQISYQFLHTHFAKFFFIFFRPPKNRCQKVEKRGQKGVFLG